VELRGIESQPLPEEIVLPAGSLHLVPFCSRSLPAVCFRVLTASRPSMDCSGIQKQLSPHFMEVRKAGPRISITARAILEVGT
jgi:hypothetical protein